MFKIQLLYLLSEVSKHPIGYTLLHIIRLDKRWTHYIGMFQYYYQASKDRY